MHGIHTALVTPFAPDGAVDLAAFQRLAARQREAGVHGLVACGTTGEAPTLSAGEWADCVRAAVEVAEGAIPVTAGVGTYCTATTVSRVEAAAELGATAGLLVFPYYNKPNPAGLRAHVRAALEPGLPVVLYHVPGRTGQRLPWALVAELADLPGVIAVKEATGDVRYGAELIAATRTPVLSGDDFTFVGLLAVGGAGCISVVSNVAPRATVAAFDAFRRGDVGEARERFHALLPLVRYLFSDTNPVPCKMAMNALGLCHAAVRLPLAAASEPTPDHLLEVARRWG